MKHPRTTTIPATRPGGFTLIELMFALAVAAIVIGIAVPNMRSFILNNRLSSTATEMIRSMQTARTEATKRQQNVVVCFTADLSVTTPTCVTSGYVAWILFEDTNKDLSHDAGETILEAHTFESDKYKVFADNGKFISYAPTGFRVVDGSTTATKNSTSIVVCDSRNYYDVSGGTTGQSMARGLIITNTGRARITREVTNTTTKLGVKELLSNTGGSC